MEPPVSAVDGDRNPHEGPRNYPEVRASAKCRWNLHVPPSNKGDPCLPSSGRSSRFVPWHAVLAARLGDFAVGFSVQFSPVIANITSFSQSTMICVFEIFIQVIRMPSPQPEYKQSE
ncbi:hypothetical protein GQ55_7G286900 [Panicum hallii var. hallii]|uniref:Uncharacterized protein n=1 Tax=Panicum hallii var. hallii TaxID=1504633 RepID=A0A2T7D030_9POAL|nr:hypothetical protein GQ55_7G286900 [Panicum hallii var. hallii]